MTSVTLEELYQIGENNPDDVIVMSSECISVWGLETTLQQKSCNTNRGCWSLNDVFVLADMEGPMKGAIKLH